MLAVARFGDGGTAAGLIERRQRPACTDGGDTPTVACENGRSGCIGAECRVVRRRSSSSRLGCSRPLPEGPRRVLQHVRERHLGGPDQLRVRAQVRPHQQRLLPDRPERPRVRRGERRLHRRVERPERPAEDDHARVEQVDQAGQPEADPLPRLAHPGDAAAVADGDVVEHVLDVGLARVPADRADDRRVADLRLPAPARPARAHAPARLDDDVPDLARVPAGALEQLAVDDDAAADADLAADVQHVLRAARGPAQVLGDDPEVAVVADGDRVLVAGGLAQQLRERHLVPAQRGRAPHQPVRLPHAARHRDDEARGTPTRGRDLACISRASVAMSSTTAGTSCGDVLCSRRRTCSM